MLPRKAYPRIHRPKAYGEIKPLYGHTGQPIRCTPIVVPEIEDRPDCVTCRFHICTAGRCEWSPEDRP